MMSTTDLVDGPHGEALLIRTWPRPDDPVASLVIVHGLAEHSGRFEHVGAEFAKAGLAVVSFDLAGHGRTVGKRAFVEHFDHFLDMIDSVRPEGTVVLYGHSLGGLIALKYSIDRIPPDALILSAPALDANVPAWQRAVAPVLSRLLPGLALPNAWDPRDLSSDEEVAATYASDPLVTTKTTARLGAEIFAAMDEVEASLPSLTIPTLVIHGGADTIVPARFSAALGELPNVTRKLYPRLKHECHNEPEGPGVIQDMIDFVEATL